MNNYLDELALKNFEDQPFTTAQIIATQNYLGSRTHLIDWMEKHSVYGRCKRCGILEENTELKSHSGWCEPCYGDQTGK